MKPKILLHACCAVCTAGVWDRLKNDYDITLFWYNPNIFPKDEHDRRLTELLNFCDRHNIKILYGDYDWEEEHNFWLKKIKGYENQPERGLPAMPGKARQAGKRCEICYKIRLEATATMAKMINNHHKNSFNFFGVELSISPHKNAEKINKIGEQVGEKIDDSHSRAGGNLLKFYSADFKKNDGFKKASEFSRKNNLYRQNYCGCEFSRKKH